MRDVYGEGGLSRSEQLVEYFYNVLGVTYCHTKPRLVLMQRQPWLSLIKCQQP